MEYENDRKGHGHVTIELWAHQMVMLHIPKHTAPHRATAQLHVKSRKENERKLSVNINAKKTKKIMRKKTIITLKRSFYLISLLFCYIQSRTICEFHYCMTSFIYFHYTSHNVNYIYRGNIQ